MLFSSSSHVWCWCPTKCLDGCPGTWHWEASNCWETIQEPKHQDPRLLLMPAQTFSPKCRWEMSECRAMGLWRVILNHQCSSGFEGGCRGCPCFEVVSLAVPLPAKSPPCCHPIKDCPRVYRQRVVSMKDQWPSASFGKGKEHLLQ